MRGKLGVGGGGGSRHLLCWSIGRGRLVEAAGNAWHFCMAVRPNLPAYAVMAYIVMAYMGIVYVVTAFMGVLYI